VYRCGPATRSELGFAKLLRNLPGVLLLNLMPPIKKSVEIDGLLIRPDGVRTIEVKYSYLSGALVPNANGDWKVNGAVQEQLGNPTAQARRQMQCFTKVVRPKFPELGYVDPCVLVLGRVQIDSTAVSTMPVSIYTADTIVTELKSSNGKVRLKSDDVLAIFRALQLDLDYKAIESRILNEGFARSAGRYTGQRVPGWKPPRPGARHRFLQSLLPISPLHWRIYEMSKNDNLIILWVLWVLAWKIKDLSGLRDSMYKYGTTADMRYWARMLITQDPAVVTQIVNRMQESYGEDIWYEDDYSCLDYDDLIFLKKAEGKYKDADLGNRVDQAVTKVRGQVVRLARRTFTPTASETPHT
jgi:hypothetical protein